MTWESSGKDSNFVPMTYSPKNAAEGSLMIVNQFSAGPTLGSTLIRSVVDSIDDRFVVVQYLPISRVLSDAEYKASLRSLQLVIQLTKPRMILSLDDNYIKYMPPNIYDKYKDKFFVANKGLATIGRPSCDLIDMITKRTHDPDAPIYILRDDNVAHIESSRALGTCLKDYGHDVSYYSAATVGDLKRALFDIDDKQKGILISLVNTVTDTEFNRPIDLDAINRLIRNINRTHMDIGFVRANNNLSMVIVPIVGGLDQNEKAWANMHTAPKLYVLVDRLDKLDGSLVYKNMFAEISGVLDE